MLATLIISIFALVATNLVSASLYPTKPVADTIYRAGHNASITWIDDNLEPRLQAMGHIKIDLYTSDNTYLMTLAREVDPISKFHNAYIPPYIGSNSSHYIMHFFCDDPPHTIYTADFTITNTTMHSSSSYKQDTPTNSVSTTTRSTGNTSNIQTTPDKTIVSQLPELPTASSAATTTYYTNGYGYGSSQDQGQGDGLGQLKSGGSRIACLDLEKLKFRLVFILWPALIGITMAL